MAAARTGTAQVVLPLTVQQAWALLGDTPRMVALDPLLEAYEPERGAIEAGTLNRVTARLGPFRFRLTTRTELLEAPRRAAFVSVSPSRPIRLRAEDTLEPVEGGCRYTMTATATPTLAAVGHVAARLVPRIMARSRRRFLRRLREEAIGGSAAGSASGQTA
jgi:hypothetical protein